MTQPHPAAIVTGASRGIGRAIAIRLAADGSAVAVNYAGSRDAAEAVVTEIRAAGGDAHAIRQSRTVRRAPPAVVTPDPLRARARTTDVAPTLSGRPLCRRQSTTARPRT